MGAQASPGLVKSMVSLEKKKSLGPRSGKNPVYVPAFNVY